MADPGNRFSRFRSAFDMQAVRGLRIGLWYFLDQAIISASNFFMMILLARYLGASEYGVFVLAFAALMFAGGIQGSVLTQPHNVIGSRLIGEDYRQYTLTTALLQIVFAIATSSLFAFIALFLHLNDECSRWVHLALALIPTNLLWQFHEFIRRVAFTELAARFVAFVDIVAHGTQFIALVFLWQIDRLSSVTAILAIGTGSAFGVALGTWRMRSYLRSRTRSSRYWLHVRENWIFGRWLLGGTLAFWLSSQLYPVLTAGLVNLAGAGGMRAAQTILGPTNILLQSLESIAPSRAAKAFQTHGTLGVMRYMRSVGLPVGLGILAYCIAVSSVATPLVTLLLGDDYEPYAWLVRVWALFVALTFFSNIASILLRSMSVTAPIFLAQSVSALMTLTVGITAVKAFGLIGASVGLIMSALVLNAVLWYFIIGQMRTFPEVTISQKGS